MNGTDDKNAAMSPPAASRTREGVNEAADRDRHGSEHDGRPTDARASTGSLTGEGLRSALEALVRSRFPEGLARRLESRYSLTDGELADDAVAAAVEQILRYSKSIHVDNLEAYLTASAHNVLRRLLKKKKNRGLDDLEYDETEGDALVRSEEGGRRVYELAKAEIETWEGEKMALITHLVVQATFLGEVLTTEELRDAAEPILDEVLTLDAVKTLKKRGLERLAAAFAEMGYTIDQLEES